MPTVKLELDRETFDKLVQEAMRHIRPTHWHAKALVRQALGLELPYPEKTVHGEFSKDS
jgi:hypothetical protein